MWKAGGELRDQKNKKVQNKKYILMNPARFAPHHRVVHVGFTPLRNYAPRGAPKARLKEEEDKPCQRAVRVRPPLPPIFMSYTA